MSRNLRHRFGMSLRSTCLTFPLRDLRSMLIRLRYLQRSQGVVLLNLLFGMCLRLVCHLLETFNSLTHYGAVGEYRSDVEQLTNVVETPLGELLLSSQLDSASMKRIDSAFGRDTETTKPANSTANGRPESVPDMLAKDRKNSSHDEASSDRRGGLNPPLLQKLTQVITRMRILFGDDKSYPMGW
ncbi:hypothetical protein [Microbacterium sp. YY-01]|uniref:hypothetical protein n=1 Tax=Microbacterium sp. YY-01 TaxID=3421634 RepID=UPI003D169C40